MKPPAKSFYAANRAEWRAWLKLHAEDTPEIWLIYYKKGSGHTRVPYADAVEEALCFGWIDGVIKRIDDQRYCQRFTPRKARSQWSALNVGRAKKMIAEGKMTSLGLRVFDPERTVSNPPNPVDLPPKLLRVFRANKKAWQTFQQFPPSYRRITIGWVASAKREETQQKRLDALIRSAADGKRIQFM